MESVHNPSRRTWIDDNVINLREFLKEFSDHMISETSPSNDSKDAVPAQVLYDIENECGLDALRCDYQERVESNDQLDIPVGVHLQTLRYQKEHLEKRKKDRKYFNSHYVSMKYARYPSQKVFKVDLNKLEPGPVNVPDAVLSVQIHSPVRKLDSNINHGKVPAFHADQEFLVLGCQFLTMLREVIDCVSDKAIPGEYSDCPHSLPTTTCKDVYKSGFFYINGVFYNDMRDRDCRDYSETIIKWSKNRGIGPFKKALMEETRFIDLSIQLGYPYVYIHQGDCEHIMVFTDVRLFSKHDVNNINAYPLYTQVKPSKRIFCMICNTYTAMWVVCDNKRLPENPFFFCKHCFFSYNYDSNDKKIGEFRAYHFPDHSRF